MAFAFAPPPIPELGTRRRLRLLPEGQRGPRPRRARRGTQPVPRHGGAEQAARQRASERAGRHAAVPHRRRLEAGGVARALDRRRQHHARDGVGRAVHRRLRRSRPRQARLHAGRRAVPHVAGRLQALVRAQRQGRNGAVHGVRQARTGTMARRGSSATTACRRSRSRARPHRVSAPARRWPRSSAWSRSCRRARRRVDRPFVPGAAGRLADAAAVFALAADRLPVPRGAV